MLANRTLLVAAATLTFVVAVCTGAEARFLCHRGVGNVTKSYHFVPRERIGKIVNTRSSPTEKTSSKSANLKSTPANPVKSASIASAVKRVGIANAASSSSVATQTDTCLVKEYLDTGLVRFRDTCTKEWAINSTDQNTKSSTVVHSCLSKQNQDGVLMFKDVCTGEWAMNTTKHILAHAQ